MLANNKQKTYDLSEAIVEMLITPSEQKIEKVIAKKNKDLPMVSVMRFLYMKKEVSIGRQLLKEENLKAY